jgi:phosphoglycerate dehydrogenase-like enzyme
LDRNAAAAALDSGRLAGLGLDVQWTEPVPPDDPLVAHPRVIMTPHIAGVTQLSYKSMAAIVMQRCLVVRAGGVPESCVNLDAFGQCVSAL